MRSPGLYMNDTSNWGNKFVQTLDVNAYWPNNPDYLPGKFLFYNKNIFKIFE